MSSKSVTRGASQDADEDRLARILDDYLVAVERGSAVTPDAILARYPEDADKLRGYLSGLQLFHAAIAPAEQTPAAGFLEVHTSGRSIGDYRLLREIGRGGMGVVYEALQVSLHRRVALKILPFPVAHDAKQLGRFKNESQSAAQVQHPNIVPIYTVGEQDGVHFYAMQLIEGQSLSEVLHALRGGRRSDGTTVPNYTLTAQYQIDECLRHSKSRVSEKSGYVAGAAVPQVRLGSSETADHVRAVARLGVQAAQALHAAHEYGVVHRDVKPSNLLVDDQGKLWITDFGLARCRERVGLTQTGDVLGTMRYMSPEQALGSTSLIDHRTDVYSLGVTLYELAALHHPAEGLSDIQLFFERENRAPKPLRQWNRHIAVDFQTIVLKAMSENPQERYATAQELACDLNRFLEGKPILATPPTILMRANKWVKRHRRAVAAAAAVLLITSSAMAFMFAYQKTSAERSLVELRNSTHQTHEALFRLSLLGDQLASIPGAEGVRQQLFADLLGLYAQFQNQAIDDPAVATDLALAYSKSGSLFEKLNDKDRAIEAHQKALRIWRDRLAEQPTSAEYARNLALCQNNLGLLLAEQGDASHAVALLSQALERQNALRTQDPKAVQVAADAATTHGNLGLVYSQRGQKQDAAREFSAAISIQEPMAKVPTASEAVLRALAASYNNLGSLYDAQYAVKAADVYQNALRIQLQLVKSHRDNRLYQGDLARTYNNLGFLAARGNDWQKAELCYVDAIEIQKALVKASRLAGAYRRDLAVSYNNLGMVQSRHGRLAGAETSFKRALQLQDTLLKVQPSDIVMSSNHGSVFNNLGLLLDKQGRQAEAETAFRQAVAFQKKASTKTPSGGGYRSLLAGHLDNLASNLKSQSKHHEAMQVVLQRQQLYGDESDVVYSSSQQPAANGRLEN